MKLRNITILVCLTIVCAAVPCTIDNPLLAQGPRGRGAAPAPDEPRGLRLKTDEATPGYVLFAPLTSDTTFLIDNDGKVVRTWKSAFTPSAWLEFLENGHVLRGGSDAGATGFSGGGQGGRFQEFTFDGDLVWDFAYNIEKRLPHHDVALLPNGNVLAIVWELKTADEARKAGRREGFIPARGVWPDSLIEFEPQRPNGARIVWEWHMWDHLIQNVDPMLEHYGNPSEHPERIDVNGDLIATPTPQQNPPSDVFHSNAVDYNPTLDQIVISVPRFNEIWVIDHSTTTAQARGESGGRSGRGGALLYRWGNPLAYGRGTAAEQLFGFEHDVRWIPQGRPGAGHLTVFSNRTPGDNGTTYTKVYEFTPPMDNGRYVVPSSGPFGPAAPLWTYSAPDSFQATYISGAERLASGLTFISSGPQGRLFEITPAGKIVWEYWSPYSGANQTGGGQGGANPFAIFRGIRIPLNHPALAGRRLQPLDPQPDLRSPGP